MPRFFYKWSLFPSIFISFHFIYLKKYFYICDVSIKSLLNRKKLNCFILEYIATLFYF